MKGWKRKIKWKKLLRPAKFADLIAPLNAMLETEKQTKTQKLSIRGRKEFQQKIQGTNQVDLKHHYLALSKIQQQCNT